MKFSKYLPIAIRNNIYVVVLGSVYSQTKLCWTGQNYISEKLELLYHKLEKKNTQKANKKYGYCFKISCRQICQNSKYYSIINSYFLNNSGYIKIALVLSIVLLLSSKYQQRDQGVKRPQHQSG